MDYYRERDRELEGENLVFKRGTVPGRRAMVQTRNKSVFSMRTLIILVLVLAGLFILSVKVKNDISQNNYRLKLESAYEEITRGAKMAEAYASLEKRVWYNCIYEESDADTDPYTKDKNGEYYEDFNDALSSFYDGNESAFLAVYDSVLLLETYMPDLKDCQKKYKEEYSTLKSLYIAYLELTDLVVGTSNYSYNTFQAAFESAKSNYKEALHAAKLMF